MGEALAPFVFREEPKRFELRSNRTIGADDDGQPEVTGVAYEIDDVEVFGGWREGFRHFTVYGAGVDFGHLFYAFLLVSEFSLCSAGSPQGVPFGT
jgi:hypothetical protein